MDDPGKRKRFGEEVLAHLAAAYNLARWLLRDPSAAEDAVQEASLRAFRFFDCMHGASGKAWFMAIVRNACFDALKDRRRRTVEEVYDEALHGLAADARSGLEPPEVALVRAADARAVAACLAELPHEYREVVVLRELEGLAYKDIAAVVGVPIGTVMSRLARGRERLQAILKLNAPRETLR